MNWMSKLMDKNFEAIIMKLFQQGMTNSPEKSKNRKLKQRNRSYYKELNGNYKTKNYDNEN